MNVTVERCGGQNQCFRLQFKNAGRNNRIFIENPDGDFWCRTFAKQALDFITRHYNVRRSLIRFTSI